MNLDEKVNYVSNFIIADRKKYLADVIPDIEKYIYAHNLIISRNLLYILVFSHDPLRDATEIANHICEHIKYVEMRTRVPHREFDIFINFQLYARIMKVEKIANKNILVEMAACEVDEGSCMYMSLELELMYKYWRLYMVGNHEEWEMLEKEENELILQISGGNGGFNKFYSPLFELVSNLDCVIIGDYALPSLMHFTPKCKIQIISNNAKKHIEEIIRFIKKITGKNATVLRRNLLLPFDYRLRLESIVVNNEPVIDVFNNGEYELIMYKNFISGKNNIKIAHPYVLCMFLLLNLFTYKSIVLAKHIDQSKYENTKKVILSLVKKIRIIKYDKIEFYGINIPELRSLKQNASDGVFYYPYYPYKHKLTHGEYKKI